MPVRKSILRVEHTKLHTTLSMNKNGIPKSIGILFFYSFLICSIPDLRHRYAIQPFETQIFEMRI